MIWKGEERTCFLIHSNSVGGVWASSAACFTLAQDRQEHTINTLAINHTPHLILHRVKEVQH